jgi:site-specific DNA recombinase
MALPLDGYVRVSRVGKRDQVKGGEGFISPDVQEAAIRAWAKANNREVVIQPHELNVSGGTMDRPVFNSIMERIRNGQSGGLVVFKTDRFARNLVGALNTLADIGAHEAVFVSTSEPQLDYSTPSGRGFLNMLFVFAEMVRDGLTESWYEAQKAATERGVHVSPGKYLGYDRDEKGYLVLNAQAPVAREVFTRRAQRQTWGSIASWLDDVAPRPEGQVWTAQGVQRMCSHRVYLGEASRFVGRDKAGRGAIINKTAHAAIVTEDQWRAAQMTAPPVGGRQPGEAGSLLAGLLRCGGCRFQLSTGRGPKGERVYRCRPDKTTGKCACPTNVMADTIESYVEEMVLGQIDGLTQLVPDNAVREEAVAALDGARANLDAFRANRDGLRQLGATEWNGWLEGYLDDVRQAEAALATIDQRLDVVREGLTREHYLALPTAERREVLGGFVDAVMVRRSRGRGRYVDPIDTRTRILWRGDAPADLPRPRVASPIVPWVFDEDDVEAGVPAAQHAA